MGGVAKAQKREGKSMDMFDFRERAGSGVDPAIEALATRAIGAAIEVHRHLGPGMPEISYRRAMSKEFELLRIPHTCEVDVPIVYKGSEVGLGRLDILVDDRLPLELKAVESLSAVHVGQLLTYLRMTKLPLGLLINFNVAAVRSGIKRVVCTQ